jgi:uncharacterized protein (TIGR00299 family) protein
VNYGLCAIDNMKMLYLDCFSGISGDMFLGAMLDLGLDESMFLDELKKLPLSDYGVQVKKSLNSGITGTDVMVETCEHHPHRGLRDIYEIIDESRLKPKVKEKSKEAFLKLARAEGKIHGKSPEEIHFHEVGAVDSIIDIVGACILMEMLSPASVVASPVNVGSGTVKCAHGILPVPAPATIELLNGIPAYSAGEDGELTTPTGALLLSVFVDKFGKMPHGTPVKTGYGLGKAVRKSPNVLRAVLIDAIPESDMDTSDGLDYDKVAVLEANIDDMNPQFYSDVLENLFSKGALDVFLTPIIMKKSRPGIKLTCICEPDKRQQMAETILEETTTLGVRWYLVERYKLYRDTKTVETSLGKVRIKVSKKGNDIIRITPEYEDLRAISRQQNMSVLKTLEVLEKKLKKL